MTQSTDRLLNFARQKPNGFTSVDATKEFDWSYPRFVKVVRRLREFLTDSGEALVCTPQMPFTPWVYRLTSEMEAINTWVTNRIVDMESRLQTIHNMASCAVKATRPQTANGKRARLIYKGVGRMLEDLREIADENAS